VDRRAIPLLAAGLAGLSLGALGALTESVGLGAAAGAASLVTAVFGLRAFHQLKRAESERPSPLAAIDSYLPPPGTPSLAELEVARSVLDPSTGLPDARYFEIVAESRVAAARRHLWPVTIVLIQLELDEDRSDRHRVLPGFALLMRRTLREADIACRLGDTTFGLVLENTAEEGGVWTAERLQIALAKEGSPIRRLAAGVSTYPTHGLKAAEVLARARIALDRACSTEAGHGLGQVEVATADQS
jgi:diguanylate cyclase (GGDEF)-like protein